MRRQPLPQPPSVTTRFRVPNHPGGVGRLDNRRGTDSGTCRASTGGSTTCHATRVSAAINSATRAPGPFGGGDCAPSDGGGSDDESRHAGILKVSAVARASVCVRRALPLGTMAHRASPCGVSRPACYPQKLSTMPGPPLCTGAFPGDGLVLAVYTRRLRSTAAISGTRAARTGPDLPSRGATAG